MVSKTTRVKEIVQRKRRLSRQAREMEHLSEQAEEEVPMETGETPRVLGVQSVKHPVNIHAEGMSGLWVVVSEAQWRKKPDWVD